MIGLKAAAPTAGPAAPMGGLDPSTGPMTPPGVPAVYMGPDQGPFECDNCQYFTAPSLCAKEEVVQELGMVNGQPVAQVDPKGCCNYFESAGTGGGTPSTGPVGALTNPPSRGNMASPVT